MRRIPRNASNTRKSRIQRQFRVSVQHQEGAARVVIAGELDLASVPEVDRVLLAVAIRDIDRLVVDLRDVDFIDSTGLRLLLSLRNDAKRIGYRLSLQPPRGAAARIFRITGTRGLFEWTD
jgi:anti-anti-sigma factor